MRNDTLYTKNLGNYIGFDIVFEALVEYEPLENTFESTDVQEYYTKIDSGELVYFCAHVMAFKAGVKLGDEYLSGCLYNSYEEFINQTDEYITDMIQSSISEAKETIKKIIEQ